MGVYAQSMHKAMPWECLCFELVMYSAFCYAINPTIKWFFSAIYIMLDICVWDYPYFTLIFSKKYVKEILKILYLWVKNLNY